MVFHQLAPYGHSISSLSHFTHFLHCSSMWRKMLHYSLAVDQGLCAYNAYTSNMQEIGRAWWLQDPSSKIALLSLDIFLNGDILNVVADPSQRFCHFKRSHFHTNPGSTPSWHRAGHQSHWTFASLLPHDLRPCYSRKQAKIFLHHLPTM